MDLTDKNEDTSATHETLLADGDFGNDIPFIIHTDRINGKSLYACSYPQKDPCVLKNVKDCFTTQDFATSGDVQPQVNLLAPIGSVVCDLQSNCLKDPAEILKAPMECSGNEGRPTTRLPYLDEKSTCNGLYQRDPMLVMSTLYDTESPHRLLEGIKLSQVTKGNYAESAFTSTELTLNEQNSLGKSVHPNEETSLPALNVSSVNHPFGLFNHIKEVEEPQREQGKHGESEEFRVTSGIIKRSSSLISDSGIESEPSSVAWSDARSRALELSGDREVLHQLVRRHTVHRNSLEGGHTESNTSLPSGIQASLTSISSLPYEEEEHDVEPNKLTKSISAPQISSPDESVNSVDLSHNSKTASDIVDGQYIEFGYTSMALMGASAPHQYESKHGGSEPSTIMAEYPHSALDQNGNVSQSPHDAESFSVTDCTLETAEVPDCLKQNLHGAGEYQLLERNRENKSERMNNYLEATNVHLDTYGEEANLYKCPNLYSTDFEAFSHYNTQELNTGCPTPALLGEGHCCSSQASSKKSNGEISDLEDIELDNRSTCESYCAEPENGEFKMAANGTGFHSVVPESKKAVEVVNLSVSCTATCLPFSSVLKEAPPGAGFSSKVAVSPITHQPVGSFGVISCNSSNVDEEANERMLR